MSSKDFWKWFGGFFDGEGSCCGFWHKKKDKYYRNLIISVGQKDKAPLLLIKKHLAVGQVNTHCSYKGHHLWQYHIWTRQAQKVAYQLLPYLHTPLKIRQVKKALKFYENQSRVRRFR